MKPTVFKRIGLMIFAFALISCGDNGSAPFNDAALGNLDSKSLYVVSGTCYGGGVTTSVGPSNTITKYNLTTGRLEKVIMDYNQISPGDSPVAIYEFDSTRLLALIENTGGRRFELVQKDGSGSKAYLMNVTALSGIMRGFALLSDLSILVSKSTAIEKFNGAKARVMNGASPFISAPGLTCATSATLMSSIAVHPNGKIIYTHAAATPNNKIGVISSTGYATTADCLGGTAGPTTTALPTKALFHPSGKLLVSFGSTTLASNFIYSYDFDATTGALSNPTAAYSDGGAIVNGPSTMTVDPDSGDVFVANATSTYNSIERFHYTAGTLQRASGSTFIPYSAYTRCVSDMKVLQ